VQFDSAWVFQNLQLIPIKFSNVTTFEQANPLPKNIISLEQAIQIGKISIKEIKVDKGSDVGVLVVKNNSGKSIIVNSGELLTGGKQDRVIGVTDILLPQKQEQYITVFCVEKGRWDDKPKTFVYQQSADFDLKQKIDIEHRQSEIWKQIEQTLAQSKQHSPTFQYAQLLQQMQKSDSTYMSYFIKKFQVSDSSYAGFIAVSNNRIIGCELYASCIYTNLYFKNIVSSFVHALKPSDSVPVNNRVALKLFTDSLFTSENLQKQFLLTHGKIDKFQNKVIHLTAFGN
jgi:hypothetical protein